MSTASDTARFSDPEPPEFPEAVEGDTTCLPTSDLRTLLDAVATGDAGFDRLEFELRLHARTQARLTNTQQKVIDANGIAEQERGKTEERTAERDQWKDAYEDQRKRDNRQKVGMWALIAILTYMVLAPK